MYMAPFSSRARVFGPALAAILALATTASHAQSSDWLSAYRGTATNLITESLSSHFAWERLALIGDTFGHRLSGSEGLANAITWAVA